MEPDTITARAARTAALLAAAVAATIIMTWPLATHPARLGRTANSGDARFSVWNVAWVAHSILTDPRGLFDANIYYPHRDTLAYSEANLFAGIAAVPVWGPTRNALLAHNVVVLLAFVLSLAATWALARRVTGDAGAAAVSAILFAFCPFVFSHMPHIQLLMTFGFPLSLLMLHRVVDAPSIPAGAALGVALAVQTLACAYYGVFAVLIVGYGILFYAWSRRQWRSARYWGAAAAGAIVSIVIVAPLFLQYLRMQQDLGFRRSLDDAVAYAAYLRSYLASAAHAHAWMLPLIKEWNHEVLFPGFLASGLGVAGFILAVRTDGGTNAVRGPLDRETAMFYGSLGVLALWASLGPRAGLYTLFFNVIPVFSFLRAPGRMGVVVTLALAVLAGFAVRGLKGRWGRARAMPAALCAMALIELNGLPLDWRVARPPSIVYEVLAQLPRGPVAEFPFWERRPDFHLHTWYMLDSTIHWQPLVNGYSDYIPPDFRTLAATLASFPSLESFDAMKRYRVRYIALHRDLYGRERAAEIESGLRAYHTYLRPVAEDDRMLLLEITGWPR